MNSEEDEFRRIEAEAKRRAARDDDDTQGYVRGHYTAEQMLAWGKACAAAEREEIAQLADASVNADQYPTLTMLAQAIRMRGDAAQQALECIDNSPQQQAAPVVDCPRCGHVCSQRLWVDLTDEDWEKVANRKNTVLDTFEQGATWAAYKLERRNT